MRYCHQCHRLTSGDPLYCSSCGSTYDAKLCPSRHINPRSAQVCSQCGSRDLSNPAPRMPLLLAPFLFFLSLLPGVVLSLVLVAVVLAMFQAILTNQQIQSQLIALLIILALLWYAYIHLPHFIQNLFRSIWRSKKKDRRPH
jgi:RNA polymerase subunit RPABC4/transcription elongation factor Spt4